MIPKYATHPGEILKDELEARVISRSDFAEKIGFEVSKLNDLIDGKIDVDAKLALSLEQSLDIDFDFWMSAQVYYFIDQLQINKNKKQKPTMEKLIYFQLDNNAGDPVEHDFQITDNLNYSESTPVTNVLDEILDSDKNIVWLCSYKKEIYVSSNADRMYDWIVDSINTEYDGYDEEERRIHLQEYRSYEDAYAVALTMREPDELCYNK